MHKQQARNMTNDEMLSLLSNIAERLGKKSLTQAEFNLHAPICAATLCNRFGSWAHAHEKAGLEPTKLQKRYSDADCFENLLSVWTHYGRTPKYKEMSLLPSTITGGAYRIRWGSWNKALKAFV